MMKSDQMKSSTVFRKTPAGEEAVQERRISQRNLRSVLIMINGQASVAEIIDRFGDPLVVEGLIAELEHRGLVEPLDAAAQARDVAPAVASTPVAAAEVLDDWAASGPGPITVTPPVDAGSAPGSGGVFSLPIPDHHRAGKVSPLPEKSHRRKREWTVEWPRIMFPRITFGRILALLLLALLIAATYLWMRSFDGERRQLEAVLSEWTGHTVQISGLGLELSPYPALVARRVIIGAPERGSIEQIRFVPSPGALLGGTVDFARIEVVRPRITTRLLEALAVLPEGRRPPWGERRIRLRDASVVVAGMDVPGWNGEAGMVSPRGGMLVSLRQDAGRTVEFRSRENAWDVQATVFGWKPAEGSVLRFDLLEVAGTLNGADLKLAKVTGRMNDAPIAGTAAVDTETGSIDARFTLTRLAAGDLRGGTGFPLLKSGDFSGEFNYRGNVRTLLMHGQDLTLSGRVDVRQGELALDLVQAVRSAVPRPVRGGSTRFDRLTAQMAYDGTSRTLRVEGIAVDSGLVSARGRLTATGSEQALEGLLGVALEGSATAVRSGVKVGGSLADPILTPGALYRSAGE